jgi:hypothetical protein
VGAPIEPAEWADPDDHDARTRDPGKPGRYRARRVQGYRRVWTIESMYRRGELTAEHLAAAKRFLRDIEQGDGVKLSGPMERVDRSGTPPDVPAQRMEALARSRLTYAALGPTAAEIVRRVVVDNFNITALAQWLGVIHHRAHGKLTAGLDRLVEHYQLIQKRREPPVSPRIVDNDTVLGQDRLGRWRDG